MMRQCSHIFLTDVRTFMGKKFLLRAEGSGLFVTVRNATAMKIVRRQFHRYAISRQNLDEVHSHLSRNVRENLMTILEHDPEGSIGQALFNDSVRLDRRFFCRTASPNLNETMQSKSQDPRPARRRYARNARRAYDPSSTLSSRRSYQLRGCRD